MSADLNEAAPPAEQQPPAKPSARGVILAWVRRILVVGVLAGASYQLVVQWPEVSSALASMPWHAVLLSFLAAFGVILLGPVMWRMAHDDLGSSIGLRDASMIYLVGQLGKYVPGSLWAFLVQMELGKAAGVTRLRSFTGSLVTTAIGVVTSLISGFLALPAILDGHREYLWVFVPLPLALVLIHPRALSWLVSRALRLLRRDPLPHTLSTGVMVRILGIGFLGNLFVGLHLWLLARSLGTVGFTGLLLCTGAATLALTAGMLAFFLPSGIGAREVVIVAMLATVLPTGAALTVALLSRLIFTVVDLASAGGAALLARTSRPGPKVAAE